MEGCIEWEGGRTPEGYGRKKIGTKYVLTHRQAWEKLHGPIPVGMCVLHRCDNPPCRNVEHLFLGTRGDNNRDRHQKGRTKTGSKPHTHCKKGHELTPDNSYVHPHGRQCRRCKIVKSTIWTRENRNGHSG